MSEIPSTWNNKPLVHSWAYLDTSGETLGIVARYQNADGRKDIIPCFKKVNGSGFKPGIELTTRPLFGLNMLANHPENVPVFICEGEKSAAAMQSIGLCTITSLGGSGAANKADWRPLSGRKMVYLLPDRDEAGEHYAKDVYGALVALEQHPAVKVVRLSQLPDKGDFVDWARAWIGDCWDTYAPIPSDRQRGLMEVFCEELENAVSVPDDWNSTGPQDQHEADQKPKSTDFPLVSASTMTNSPEDITWLIENFIERESINLLFGEPGSGKSLFALEWAWCVSAGMPWHNLETEQGAVVVVAGEGFAGMKRRLRALEVKYDMKAPEQLYISKQPSIFNNHVNAAMVADSINAACPNPSLVIFDTLHRNFDGDENSSQEIGAFIGNIDTYLRPMGCATLIVHHSGHGSKDRGRGSSAIRAAMDAEFSATKSESHITLECHKAKDFEALKPLMFTLTGTELGENWINQKTEQPITSVYLAFDGERGSHAKQGKTSPRDEQILTALDEAIRTHGAEPSAEIKAKFAGFSGLANKDRSVVHIEHWRGRAYPVIDVDGADDLPQAKRKAFKRARDKFVNAGLIRTFNDYWWRITQDDLAEEVKKPLSCPVQNARVSENGLKVAVQGGTKTPKTLQPTNGVALSVAVQGGTRRYK
jgi:RecA-family ATPase